MLPQQAILSSQNISLSLTIVVLIVTGFAPVLAVFAQSFIEDGHITLANYIEVFSSTNQWRLLRNSILLSLTVALTTAVLGIPLGILMGKTNLPFRKFLLPLFVLPFVLPPFFFGLGWFHILNRQGLLAHFLWDNSFFFGFGGCVLVLTTVFLPIVILLTIAFLRTIPSSLEEAARLIAGWKVVLLYISLPLIRAGLIFATTLVFLLTLGEVTVPMFLRYDVFAARSLTQFAAFYDFGTATAAAVPLCLVALLVIIIERTSLEGRIDPADTSYAAKDLVIDLKFGRLPSLLLVLLLCCVILAPLLAIVLRAGTLSNYVEALRQTQDSLLRSLFFALTGATLLIVTGFFAGYLILKKRSRLWPWVDSFTIFLFALPGPVIAIGLISMWNHPTVAWVYSSPVVILLGYTAQYIALTSRISAASIARISQSMEEAAQMAGASWMRRIMQITVPLAAPGLIAGWLIAYIFCMKETAITMMVYPPGSDNLTVRILTLMANSPEEQVAASCVLLISITAIPLMLLFAVRKRKLE
ncbi:iron ABC transporter permease [bacterium]|nr:iron ABC transporter permease [bacterium]